MWCLVAGLAVLGACDDVPPVQRGFSSRQLYAIRDPTLVFRGWNNGVWTYSTVPGNALEYWSIDIETGAVQDLGPELPPYTYPTPPPQRYVCQSSKDGPPYAALITDTSTGITTTIAGVMGGWTCPAEADPTLSVWIQDVAGDLTYWTGPYDHLTQVPIDLVVEQLAPNVPTLDLGGWQVLGSLPGKRGEMGFFRIDAATFAVTPILPPELTSAAWADGSTPQGALTSNTLSTDFFMPAGPGLYFYSRGMSDGRTTLFVGPFATAPTELALFDLQPMSQLNGLGPSPGQMLIYTPPAGGGADIFVAFNQIRKHLTLCPSPFTSWQTLAHHPAGDFTAVWSPGSTTRPLLLMGAGACATPASDNVIAAGFSPDQTTLAWLTRPVGGDGTFWAAAIDGSDPRALGGGGGTITDSPNAPRFFGAGGQLQFQLDEDLVWLDVHDDPARLHYVAEHLSGRVIDLGKWLVGISEHSAQAGTGRLSLMERATGTKRLISPEVASFDTLLPQTQGPDALAPFPIEYPWNGVHQFIYVVRGRNPSPQDGIWLATIAASDLQ